MKICFVSNFHKTFLFDKIAQGLESQEIEIFWICFSSKAFNYLSSIYDKKKILLLNKNLSKETNVPIGDYKINELVNGDRSLRHQLIWGFDYLVNIQKPFYDFVKNNEIKFVFGETTYAHEVLMSRILKDKKELKSHYLHPQSVRIPDGRFFFLEDEFQNKIFKSDKIVNESWENEYEIIKVKPPKRVKQVDKEVQHVTSFKGKVERLKRFFSQKNIEKDHPSLVTNRYSRTRIALQEEANRLLYSLVHTHSIDHLNDKKFVIYTLHMQPEASVDVVGAYYDNQLQNIINIWRILPEDWFLVIKEHSNAIGNRGLSFFRTVRKLRNAVIIKETASSHKLIDLCQLVFTVSGTIAYEAALKGKMAFTFGDIFFNKLKGCHKISLDHFRNFSNIKELTRWAEEQNEKKLGVADFSKFLFRNSYKGIVDAPVGSEDWLEESNSKQLIKSFNVFLTSHNDCKR